jgi:hypothetical protein
MPDMHVRVGGAWKKVNRIWVRVGGVWKETNNAYVRVGGAWKKFFQNAVFSLSWGDLHDIRVNTTSTVILTIQRDGDVAISANTFGAPGADDWIVPRGATVGDNYEVRLTVNTGSTPSGDTSGSWLAINTDRTWQWAQASAGTTEANVTVEIRPTGGSAVVSNTFNVTAEYQSI